MAQVAKSSEEVTEAVSHGFEILIVGGGILGTAVASLASEMGFAVLVARLSDSFCPKADTLRNQGWLQSGTLFNPSQFRNTEEYYRIVRRTFNGGRNLLRSVNLPIPNERGVLRVLKGSDAEKEIEARRKKLRFPEADFRRLERDEAVAIVEDLHEDDS
ncbi:MAG TPA: FAD-dependent oxidoreductase, partial [Thermoanaerobaculia bacterium]